jgi:hypothetical protein
VSVTITPSGPAPRQQSGVDARCRGVGVERQQHRHVVARRVREIDACVRAHEAVRGLADQYALAAPDHALGLAQDRFDVARVLAVLFGDAACLVARLERA